MNKLREFVYRYKVTCAIIVLLVSSFSIYYFAFAEGDEYENQTEVKSTSVTIESGTNVSVDACTGKSREEIIASGMDCATDDDIVRNFDEIRYTIKYTLGYKENTTENAGITRNVVIDVLLPSELSAEVSEGEPTSGEPAPDVSNVTINGKQYVLYQFEEESVSISDELETMIRLSKINTTAGTEIKPIIRVREATDKNPIAIGDNANLENINLDEINNVNVKPIVVSAKERYGIKLYQGSSNKDGSKLSVPIGVLVYIPKNEDGSIKGVQIPGSVNFNINITANNDDSKLIDYKDLLIENYDQNKGLIQGLPNPYDGIKNGQSSTNVNESSINKEVQENTYKSVIPVTIEGLTYQDGEVDLNNNEENPNLVNYISSKMLTIKVERERNKKETVEYMVGYSGNDGKEIREFLFEDNYEKFPGDYHTKIDFIDSKNFVVSGVQDKPNFTKRGDAVYNYGEEFYIQNTIVYGQENLGDTLENGFTNYIKIDNSAIKIIELENSSGNDYFSYVDTHNPDDSSNEYIVNLEYGIGEWNKDNFELTGVSGCPTDIDSLTKEDLMNLYGGQCIREKSGKKIKWYDSIIEAANEDENYRNNIIAIRVKTDHSYNLGVETIVRLKAQAVNNHLNVGKTFQIVSCGQTEWNNKTHYLSTEPKKSVLYLNYSKDEIKSNEEHGNTVKISAFKASINTIKIEDVYGAARSTIYSGINDPIEIKINPVIYKDSSTASIIGSQIRVYLPKTLELQIHNGDKVPTNYSNPEVDEKNNIYIYDYSEEDISFENESSAGTIPNLIIHANIKIDTSDETKEYIKATISGKLKPNTDAITTYTDVTSIEKRTKESDQLTLKNTREVNSVGKVNTLYIDKNKSYTYNMKSVNLLEESKIELLNILPFNGDSIGKGSKFNGTVTVSINELPEGYIAKYTTTDPKTILSSELNGKQIDWITWTDYTKAVSATAIKIEQTGNVSKSGYFGSENGINITINTSSNKETDIYANRFYMLKRNADICVNPDLLTGGCTSVEKGTASFSSNISYVSVYNRTISGIAFEDLNFDGFSDNEKRMKDIPVELYSLSKTDFDPKKPSLSISDEDKLVAEGITDRKGRYSFKDLPSGNYYVKYIIDCEKYTVTEKNKQDPTVEGDTSLKDSDAEIVTIKEGSIEKEEDKKETKAQTCYAVSNILSLNDTNVAEKSIDLGLRPREDFDIKIKKYITRIDVNSDSGNKTYKYNNVTKVNLDIRNLKNTSFRVTYGMEIENSKFFPGTIGNIVETIPEGMTFNPGLKENNNWYESDGLLYYSGLNKTIIRPGEKYHLTIVLDLVTDSGGDYVNFVAANDLQIMPVITNFAEITPAQGFEQISKDDKNSGKEGEE